MNLRAIAAALLLAAATAAADSSVPAPRPAAPSPGDRERARKLYSEGVQLYDAKKFGAAAEKFERALAAADAPQVLFNIAQARRMNGERKAALVAYRGFLARMPETPDRKAVEQLIADLETANRSDGGAQSSNVH